MRLLARTTTILFLTFALSACYNTHKKSPNEAIQEPLAYWTADQKNITYDEPVNPQETVGTQLMPSPYLHKTVLFSFDRSQLDQKTKKILTQLVDDVLENPNINLRVEGHTDERGSREYNIGLGWRRAHTVSTYLQQQGIGKDKIDAVSYGKEKPTNPEHTPTAWKKNRRVEIILHNNDNS
jgi:peptidoglycan-associated lipoprotein